MDLEDVTNVPKDFSVEYAKALYKLYRRTGTEPDSAAQLDSEESETLLRFDVSDLPIKLQETDPYKSRDHFLPLDSFMAFGEHDSSTTDTVSTLIKQSAETSPDCTDAPNKLVNLEKLLDLISPPQEDITSVNEKHISQVSRRPATFADAITVDRRLDSLLAQHHEPFKLCSARQRLIDDALDEAIRQILVSGLEEVGELLLKVREELYQSRLAFQHLVESTVSFSMLKSVKERMGSSLKDKIRVGKDHLRNLSAEYESLLQKEQAVMKAQAKEREEVLKKETEEIEYLRTTNLRLKKLLNDLPRALGHQKHALAASSSVTTNATRASATDLTHKTTNG